MHEPILKSKKSQFSNIFLHQHTLSSNKICNFVGGLIIHPRHIVLNSFTITTVSKRANHQYWDCTYTGADFPYLVVVCGEP